jgi:hypothetical protein
MELEEIVHALIMWRHYLLRIMFFLMTNHCCLKYFFDQPSLNTRHARWMALISEFDFEILHIKGKENRVEDTLNWSVKTIHLVVESVGESDIKKNIKTLFPEDEFFNQVREGFQQEPRERKY